MCVCVCVLGVDLSGEVLPTKGKSAGRGGRGETCGRNKQEIGKEVKQSGRKGQVRGVRPEETEEKENRQDIPGELRRRGEQETTKSKRDRPLFGKALHVVDVRHLLKKGMTVMCVAIVEVVMTFKTGPLRLHCSKPLICLFVVFVLNFISGNYKPKLSQKQKRLLFLRPHARNISIGPGSTNRYIADKQRNSLAR